MRTRSFVALAALCVVALGSSSPAAADPKSDMAQKSKEAMDSYDMMDYDAAKKQLNQAIVIAKKAKLEKDQAAAKVYLNLGIATFAAGDQEGAKVAFLSAVQIDPKIQIEPAYRQPALVKLLEAVRTEVTGSTGDTQPALPPGPPAVDCATVTGVQHTIIDAGKTNVSLPIEAYIGSDVTPAKVSAMYRPEGATDFIESRLTKQGDCKYTGSIPGSAVKGTVLHYYVAAYDANNRVIAGRGTSGSPNLVELTAGPAGKGDGEDPIGNPGGGSGGGVSGGVTVSGPAKIYVGVAGGTGFGYVTGKTEFDNEVENCCIGNSLIVITPEVGYYVNPQLTIGIAVRLGIPVGANLEGHSTAAPGGLVRARYSLSPSGEGVRLLGQIGAGILRNTIKLNNAMDGMDTDIVAQGPLLIGAGVGYTRRLSGKISFMADFSAIGAFAVVGELGSAPNLNSGLSADLSVGVAVGF
jgi:hypothetical protein